MSASTSYTMIFGDLVEHKPNLSNSSNATGGRAAAMAPFPLNECVWNSNTNAFIIMKAAAFTANLVATMDSLSATLKLTDAENPVKLLSDDMIMLTTKRLLHVQEEFRKAGKPTHVDIGFHYTHSSNVASIQQHGLLSPKERKDCSVQPHQNNGAKYGEGIYAASDLRAYHGIYGNVGIIVVRLLGKSKVYDGQASSELHDSVTVLRHWHNEFTVLPSSSQCMPILQFNADRINKDCSLHPGNLVVDKYCNSLQHVADVFLNAKKADGPEESISPQVYETIRYANPLSPDWQSVSERRRVEVCSNPVAKCSTCLGNAYFVPIVQFPDCCHVYHEFCAGQFMSACPICCEESKVPSGVMIVTKASFGVVEDYGSAGAIRIEYVVPGIAPESFRDNPGVSPAGFRYVAWLPDTAQGRNLLKRLKHAFRQGLTFRVGVGGGTVHLAAIPHKTSPTGGPSRNGFPDPDYVGTCNRRLDELKVPLASSLP